MQQNVKPSLDILLVTILVKNHYHSGFYKGMHCLYPWGGLKNTISNAKAKKHHIDKLDEKVSIYGGANKLIAYLVYDSEAVMDINEDKISNINGNTMTNSNVSMSVEA